MNNTEFTLEEIGRNLTSFQNKAKITLPELSSIGVKGADEPISLVVAGQYSAGKSTILKALTGISEIATGEGIVTQQTSTYHWNGLTVVDTPGIGTELHPEHDEIALAAIEKADMLIYVVTHNLFNQAIGDEFRNLLIEKDKAGEMILLVNKMAKVGNTPEMRSIKEEDLKKVTTPFDPTKDLRTCFIDMESYLDREVYLQSDDPEDIEIAEAYLERSNYPALVETINSFVHERGFSARMTTNLYEMVTVIEEKMELIAPTMGDTDLDAFSHQLHQERTILSQSKRDIESSVKRILQEKGQEIRQLGLDLANEVENVSSEKELQQLLSEKERCFNEIAADCGQEMEHTIIQLSEEFDDKLQQFRNSSFHSTVQNRLNAKFKEGNPLLQAVLKNDFVGQGGRFLVKNSIGDITKGGLKQFSNSKVHSGVLNIGRKLGYKFKSWEAVKMTKNFNVLGKYLGAAAGGLAIYQQIREDSKEKEAERELGQMRDECRGVYLQQAKVVVNYYTTELQHYLEATFIGKIQVIEEEITTFDQLKREKSIEYGKLLSLKEECMLMIARIHSL